MPFLTCIFWFSPKKQRNKVEKEKTARFQTFNMGYGYRVHRNLFFLNRFTDFITKPQTLGFNKGVSTSRTIVNFQQTHLCQSCVGFKRFSKGVITSRTMVIFQQNKYVRVVLVSSAVTSDSAPPGPRLLRIKPKFVRVVFVLSAVASDFATA